MFVDLMQLFVIDKVGPVHPLVIDTSRITNITIDQNTDPHSCLISLNKTTYRFNTGLSNIHSIEDITTICLSQKLTVLKEGMQTSLGIETSKETKELLAMCKKNLDFFSKKYSVKKSVLLKTLN